jgi:hypothetical protein
MQIVEPRIPDIAGTVPEALDAMLAFGKAAYKGAVSRQLRIATVAAWRESPYSPTMSALAKKRTRV